MKIHILGCWGAYPAGGGATTGFLIEFENAQILLDCGSGVLAQLLQVTTVADLTGVIITHHHHDHVADLGVLGYSLLLSRLQQTRVEALPIYTPADPNPVLRELALEPFAELHYIDTSLQVQHKGLRISFARTRHPIPCFAVCVEDGVHRFVFTADTAYAPEFIPFTMGADLLLCEASMYAGQESEAAKAGHMTSVEAGRLGRSAGAKRLALTHYPHYGELEQLRIEAEQVFGRPVELLKTGQILQLS
jgi:ribonuclease BN (tRNA processing enzyme)